MPGAHPRLVSHAERLLRAGLGRSPGLREGQHERSEHPDNHRDIGVIGGVVADHQKVGDGAVPHTVQRVTDDASEQQTPAIHSQRWTPDA